MIRLGTFLSAVIIGALTFMSFIRVVNADTSDFIFEGVWSMSKEPTLKNITEMMIKPLLPYNPIMIELEEDPRAMTEIFQSLYPKGNLIVLTFPLNLDDLCTKNAIEQVDAIRWDAKQVDASFFKLSSRIMRTAALLSIRTCDNGKKGKNSKFINLQRRLEDKGFCLMSHYYKEGGEGESVFLKKEIYDAIYR